MNLAYHLALAKGRLQRSRYAAAIAQGRITPPPVAQPIEVDAFSYSGEASVPEQIGSLHSFLRFVGCPRTFTIVSDGTHTAHSIRRLERVHDSVRVCSCADFQPRDLPPEMSNYLRSHPTGRQLALAMCLPKDRTAIYLDSDVLFFPGASGLRREVDRTDAPALYLRDCRLSGDENVLRNGDKTLEPVNAGFLILFRQLDWSSAVERFMQMRAAPIFFTNQSLLHVVLHANGAKPLDPARYVVQLDDQTLWSDRYAAPHLVLRHYVNPVRHKFWGQVRP